MNPMAPALDARTAERQTPNDESPAANSQAARPRLNVAPDRLARRSAIRKCSGSLSKRETAALRNLARCYFLAGADARVAIDARLTVLAGGHRLDLADTQIAITSALAKLGDVGAVRFASAGR